MTGESVQSQDVERSFSYDDFKTLFESAREAADRSREAFDPQADTDAHIAMVVLCKTYPEHHETYRLENSRRQTGEVGQAALTDQPVSELCITDVGYDN